MDDETKAAFDLLAQLATEQVAQLSSVRSHVDRLRVDLMARMDRLQDAATADRSAMDAGFVQLGEDVTVVMATSVRDYARLENQRTDVVELSKTVGMLHRRLRALEDAARRDRPHPPQEPSAGT